MAELNCGVCELPSSARYRQGGVGAKWTKLRLVGYEGDDELLLFDPLTLCHWHTSLFLGAVTAA